MNEIQLHKNKIELKILTTPIFTGNKSKTVLFIIQFPLPILAPGDCVFISLNRFIFSVFRSRSRIFSELWTPERKNAFSETPFRRYQSVFSMHRNHPRTPKIGFCDFCWRFTTPRTSDSSFNTRLGSKNYRMFLK